MHLAIRIPLTIFLVIVMIGPRVLRYFYKPKTGMLFLSSAPAPVSIDREVETGIAHIHGQTFESAIFGQGYAHASTRLWQMERMRRVFRGTTAELFGEESVHVDKFSRHIGFFSKAKESLPLLREEERDVLDAYSAGVNAFLDNISLIGGKTCTANLLPPELKVLGVSKLEPWEPADTLALARLMGL